MFHKFQPSEYFQIVTCYPRFAELVPQLVLLCVWWVEQVAEMVSLSFLVVGSAESWEFYYH